MESKVTTREKIISCFKDGQTIAIGGQTGHWMPERLIDCILESGARHLTVYSIDTSDPGVGIGRLIRAKVIDRIITTHVGTNPDTNAQIQAGTLQAELCVCFFTRLFVIFSRLILFIGMYNFLY